jgi:hypothetical protein
MPGIFIWSITWVQAALKQKSKGAGNFKFNLILTLLISCLMTWCLCRVLYLLQPAFWNIS